MRLAGLKVVVPMDMLRDITSSGVVEDADARDRELGERIVEVSSPGWFRWPARWPEGGVMSRRVIDLSQPLSKDTQLHPFFPTVQILRHLLHADAAPGAKSFDAEIIITSNHAATHVDALSHFDPAPGARRSPRCRSRPSAAKPCASTCGSTRQATRSRSRSSRQALADGGLEVREGDILLFCTDHYNRTAGTPAFLDGFSGVAAECVHWMADRGVKIFGVESICPDLVYQTDGYPNHRACAERGITHYENLNNLKDVVNRRFDFYGFPLRLVPAAGSPVRAVAIVEE